jgi:hypothetical protein
MGGKGMKKGEQGAGPTRDEMIAELCAALALLRGYAVEVRLDVSGRARPVRLRIPPDPDAPRTEAP